MKSIAKVKQQRRIKNIPAGMFGFRGFGLMQHGIGDGNRMSIRPARKKERIRSNSRRMNRTSK